MHAACSTTYLTCFNVLSFCVLCVCVCAYLIHAACSTIYLTCFNVLSFSVLCVCVCMCARACVCVCVCMRAHVYFCLFFPQQKDSHIKAILLGTRYTDPFSDKLTIFCPTDTDWPEYMRVHPILVCLCVCALMYVHVFVFMRLYVQPGNLVFMVCVCMRLLACVRECM